MFVLNDSTAYKIINHRQQIGGKRTNIEGIPSKVDFFSKMFKTNKSDIL